jgi:type III secretory pathway component EscS
MEQIMKSTVGETFVAVLMSGAAALLAAICGFVVAIWGCSTFLSGEATEFALILAPVTALSFAVITFVIAFRRITTFGEHPPDLP